MTPRARSGPRSARHQGPSSDQVAAPPYVVHSVDERDVTVEWFFGAGHVGAKVRQLVLVLVGWFFVVLPVVITTGALVHRHDDSADGRWWWSYREGFLMWERTMLFLGVLVVVFAAGFLALHLLDRAATRRRARRHTFDEERLALRLEIAEDWYAAKFGPERLRHEQRRVVIEPYDDIETYELRNLYRLHGVE